MFTKEKYEELLNRAETLFPICIPSYKRWQRDRNMTLTRIIERSDPEIRHKTFVFVRGEQFEQYSNNYPSVNIVRLPDVNGLASTRQYINDFMLNEMNEPYYIDMDDDITNLTIVLFREDGKARHTKVGEYEIPKIIRLSCEIARIAFEEYNCLFGSVRRQRFCNQVHYSQTALMVNAGATPRQITFMNAQGLNKAGIRRNMIFDPTGDDVGFVAEISKHRGNMFNIPCIVYDFVDDAVNSVIRNDDNRKSLAHYEELCVKQYPMKDYIRVPFTFEDGSYKFCDIDFTKYRKATGLKKFDIPLQAVYEWMMRRKA